jgi:predicted aspartyl protease
MTGIVDDYGRAIVRITVRHPESSVSAELDAWIDTTFTGDLLLTPDQANSLKLPKATAVPSTLANGSRTLFEARRCTIEWFVASLPVGAIIGTGRFALIGVGLLEDLLVTIDYPGRTVSLTHLASGKEKADGG